MRTRRLARTWLGMSAFVLLLLQTSPQAYFHASVFGFGTLDVVDIDGNEFRNAGRLVLTARSSGNGGAADGQLSMAFNGDFAAAWGAVPGETHTFTLIGDVTDVTVEGTELVVTGTLTETDYSKRRRTVFFEEDVPFTVRLNEHSDTFLFQFCAVPEFQMEVSRGWLRVEAGGATAFHAATPAPATARSGARAAGSLLRTQSGCAR